jgi:hypothetical protein
MDKWPVGNLTFLSLPREYTISLPDSPPILFPLGLFLSLGLGANISNGQPRPHSFLKSHSRPTVWTEIFLLSWNFCLPDLTWKHCRCIPAAQLSSPVDWKGHRSQQGFRHHYGQRKQMVVEKDLAAVQKNQEDSEMALVAGSEEEEEEEVAVEEEEEGSFISILILHCGLSPTHLNILSQVPTLNNIT